MCGLSLPLGQSPKKINKCVDVCYSMCAHTFLLCVPCPLFSFFEREGERGRGKGKRKKEMFSEKCAHDSQLRNIILRWIFTKPRAEWLDAGLDAYFVHIALSHIADRRLFQSGSVGDRESLLIAADRVILHGLKESCSYWLLALMATTLTT